MWEKHMHTSTVSTPQLLADCARLINQHGPNSTVVTDFIRQHKADQEFVELAQLSRTLKLALGGSATLPAADAHHSHKGS
jgi:hypothetical protein